MSSSSDAALWITAERPDPRLSGGNIRQHHMLRELAGRLPTDLLLVGDVLDGAPIEADLRTVYEVAASLRPTPTTRLGAWALNAYLAGPGGPRETYNHGLTVRAVRQFLAKHPREYSVIAVEHAYLAPTGRFLPRASRRVITLQNVASETAAQESTMLEGRRRWMAEREVLAWKRVERRAHRDFDAIVTVSDTDAELLEHPSVMVPNGVDSSRFPETAAARDSQQVLFLGHLNFPPNMDGLSWMAESIWGRVLEAVPSAQLDVVGRDPNPRVQAAVSSMASSSLHPNVPSVDPYLARAAVSVVPLRFGTGTRLKALEAMAAGVPVVGTSIGLDGVGIVDGEHALVRDTAEGLAEAVVRVLQDRELRDRLAKQGQAMARAHFDWKPLATMFVDAALGVTG